ncbi:uncharacterized protein LOC129598913 [Paramacrobiotus metropolitanus]|uniref:uncharacterized protein LOC129598913 n=1 Tax=Paramacrobiotus metropolitanus TaxID=2943436 RepID=UPI00244647AD|nr:uncharacterized protein LOC129598913 [Paramacrobiotus metropolitanus]
MNSPLETPMLPECKDSTLTLQYKIPTEHFVVCNNLSSSQNLSYTVDIRVGKQWAHPEITEHSLTVIIKVQQSDGRVSTKVVPDAKTVAIVEATVRGIRDGNVNVERGYEDAAQSVQRLVIPPYYPDLPYELDKAKGRLIHFIVSYRITHRRSDLKNLLDTGVLTDCTLISSEGNQFPAHRAILAAQSPVFAAMFQHDTSEKATGICKIIDFEANILQLLIHFAYTRELSAGDGGQQIIKLWYAADKYDMSDLRHACEDALVASVKNENAFEYFVFARERGLQVLQRKAGICIGNNPLNV